MNTGVRGVRRSRNRSGNRKTAWRLLVDAPAATLEVWLSEACPGGRNTVTDGRWASVDAITDTGEPPEWMTQLHRELEESGIGARIQ